MQLPANFNSFSAAAKLATHVALMLASKYDELPRIAPDFPSMTRLVNRKALAAPFLHDSDERSLPLQGEIKPIHGEGVSAPVEFVVEESHPYTGIFASGGVGILRLSSATTSKPLTPGLALKIFVDGKPSVNVHAMHSLDGQETSNFFENAFTTHVAPPRRVLLKVLGFFFTRSLPFVSEDACARPVDAATIPLFEMGSISSDGTAVQKPVTPRELHFVPKVKPGSLASLPHREQILEMNVQIGTVLYDVKDEKGVPVGTLRLVSGFVASAHGDSMHFKHQRLNGDARCPFGPGKVTENGEDSCQK